MALHLVVIGDSPERQSGLGRICGDLLKRIRETFTLPPIDFIRPILLGGRGPDTMMDRENWGAQDLLGYVACTAPEDRIIVFTIYDPARVVAVADAVGQLRHYGKRDIKLWGYFAVDAEGPLEGGGFGGPARDALSEYDRILPYTEFGRQVLAATLNSIELGTMAAGIHPPLPHGLEEIWFEPAAAPGKWPADRLELLEGWTAWVNQQRAAKRHIIGINAANQPRKDWGGVFTAFAQLAKQRDDFAVWAHTDRFITEAWCFPEMAEVSGLGAERLLLTGGHAKDETLDGGGGLRDAELVWLYKHCAFTIAPGLGEGFGYPLVESQACGVPVLGVACGGGAQFLSYAVDPVCRRAEGAYLLRRPVVRDWRPWIHGELDSPGGLVDVSHLRWTRLWPSWAQWIRAGLE